MSQINEKIKKISTPTIAWHYDIEDIQVDGAIDNNSIRIGPYYQLNFSYKSQVEITNFSIPDMALAAVDENGFNYQVSLSSNKLRAPDLGQTLRISTYFLQ